MAVISVTALAIGVTGQTGPTTNEGRMLAIAATLKCEVCEGESVAQSDSDFAQQARVDIAKRLDDGQTAEQIRAFYIQHYGASVSLIPASSGVSGPGVDHPGRGVAGVGRGAGHGVPALAGQRRRPRHRGRP